MEDRIYLLWTGELSGEGAGMQERHPVQGALGQRAERWLDDTRQRKALRIKAQGAWASSVGAGLLLQKATADQRSARGPAVVSGTTPLSGAMPGQCPVRHFSVSQLIRELEAQLPAPLPLSYTYGPQGKPYLEGIPLFFSLSHSGEYVLCVVSGEEIGADIQKMQPVDYGKLASRFYDREECRILEQCQTLEERQVLFYRLWARKEALGKLTGRGVAEVLARPVCPDGVYDWQDLPSPPGYQAAVCKAIG